MDLTTTIIGVAILALCILPLAMAHNKKKKKEQQLLQALTDLAGSYSCKISQHDLWQNTAIGIDESAKCVFFIKNSNGDGSLQKVHLAGVRGSHINGNADLARAEKLELILVHASVNEPETVLEFYNPEISMQLHDELLLVKKWQDIIQQAIRK